MKRPAERTAAHRSNSDRASECRRTSKADAAQVLRSQSVAPLPAVVRRTAQTAVAAALRLVAVALTLAVLAFAIASANAAEPVRIAAAADLQPVLPTILAAFTKQSGIEAQASYQSSATLATQIENGAPFDLFLAADTSFPQRLIAAGLAEQPQPIVYARGTLVLWARKDSPLLARSRLSLDTLRDPSLHTLAVANPDHAPYGRAARAALTSLGLLPALQPKLVIAENIAQTAQFASTGNADLGLLSLTSALTPQLREQGVYVAMPASAYPPILQGAITLKHAAQPAAARAFLDYLATPAVRQSLAARGLTPPQ